ncbi:MAG: hypothetical protein SynsKO_33340 [Synoicihabitans sp.]
MKTSLILFAVATAVPFFTLAGVSVLGAFAITTALSIVAMLSLDYDNSRTAGYELELAAVPVAKPAETHAFAA